MIDRIFKPKGSRIWRWRIRLRPEDVRIEDISLGTSDKQVAEKRRTDLRREKEHERGGLLHPKPIRESALRHMAQHLAEFLSDMRRRGKSEKYLSNLEFRAFRLLSWRVVGRCRRTLRRIRFSDGALNIKTWPQRLRTITSKRRGVFSIGWSNMGGSSRIHW